MQDRGEFLRSKFGGRNWVLACRSRRIAEKYGPDVICVSQKQYAAAEHEWRELYGDPHDKTRAGMYVALRAIRAHLEAGDDCRAIMIELARAAMDAELKGKW